MAQKKKTQKGDVARPSMLGSGSASAAGSAIVKRRREQCKAGGGKWNSAQLRCEW